MRRLLFLALIASSYAAAQAPSRKTDLVYEASITELQAAMTSGRMTSVALVDAYFARIKAYDHAGPALNAMIRINPNARAQAALLDSERKSGHVRGPLHGIPIILKDNYGTTDLITTAGSIALANFTPAHDAFQVMKLRAAGAIILGKSNLHELASGITSISSAGGQTCNPYDPDRNPGGSSGGSGAAVAASFAAIAWGSDTCGSIRFPSASNNLFGLRPTKGLSSIAGIVPLSHSQDVGGPLARTVTDLAIGLDATIGVDTADTATAILLRQPVPSFAYALKADALRGAHFGIVTAYFGTEPDDQEAARVVRAAIEKMKAAGATFEDVPLTNLDSLAGRASVINYEFKYDLMDYLALTPGDHIKTLKEILDQGLYHQALEGGLRTRETQGTRDSDPYKAALKRRGEVRDIVVKYMDDHHLDGMVYPTLKRKPALMGEAQRGGNCQLAAVTGLPEMSMPAGFTPDGLPIGIAVLGRQMSDAKLVGYAFSYEQATHPRHAPDFTPALVNGKAPAPITFITESSGNGAKAKATFRFEPWRHMLSYDVRVSGAKPAELLAVSIDRGSAEKGGPMLQRLNAPGEMSTFGQIKLTATQLADLTAGHFVLSVFTTGHATGAARAVITPPTPSP